jgi:hypothetical protein
MTHEMGGTGEPIEADEPMPDRILALAREHNAPPPTPREEIWLRVQAARRKSLEAEGVIPLAPRRVERSARWMRWAVGVAALLLIGIGLGRLTVSAPATGPSTVATAPNPAPSGTRSNLAYTVATVQHLNQVENFLTTLRTAHGIDSTFNAQARELLSVTRLLQDSPDLDPRLRRLLSDLEDVLVQIAQFDAARGREELDLITDGLEERQVLPRIRTAIPSGPARAL